VKHTRVAIGSGGASNTLVELIIHEQEFLPVDIVDPALVGVAGAFVSGAGDDVGSSLVGDVVAV
jgi:hypothetical protein